MRIRGVAALLTAGTVMAGTANAQSQNNRPDASPRPPEAYAAMKPTAAPRDYLMLVFSRPIPRKEVEFDRWYTQQHVPDLLLVPGIVAGQRFKLALEVGTKAGPPPHLVTFDFRTRDLVKLTGETRRRMLQKVFVPSDSFDYASTVSGIYEKIGGPTRNPPIKPSAERSLRHYSMFVLSDPVAGQETEYNRWYDQEHIRDVLSVPGFISAQRYIVRRRVPETAIPRYLVRYELKTSDLQAIRNEIIGRIRSGRTKISPSFNAATSITRFYEAITPVMRSGRRR